MLESFMASAGNILVQCLVPDWQKTYFELLPSPTAGAEQYEELTNLCFTQKHSPKITILVRTFISKKC